MSDSSLRIGHLTVHDLARIELVETDLPPGMTVVGGNNESGKSTLLAAISTALHGKRELPLLPVRDGREKASIEVRLVAPDGSPGPTIRVSQTARGTYSLDLMDADGVPISRPMDRLAALRGAAGPDPVAMAWEGDAAKVRTAILEAVGVDTAEIDAREDALRSERTAVGRDVKRLAGALDTHGEAIVGVPEAPLRADDVTRRYEEAVATQRAAKDAESDARQETERLKETEERIKHLEAQLEDAREALAEGSKTERQAVARAKAALAAVIDPAPIRAELSALEEINAQVRHNADRVKLAASLQDAERVYARLSATIDGMTGERAQALRTAGLEVEGLDLSTGVPLLDGRPWAAASKGRRLKAAIGVLAATKATLRVAWTQSGDALDQANLQAVADLCREHDLQLIIERTGERDHGALILREGTLAT